VITSDADLLDDLLRLAAAASVEVTVAPDAAAATLDWAAAPLVVIGADVIRSIASHRLPRRTGVVLVARGGIASSSSGLTEQNAAWSAVELVGAEHLAVLPDAEAWLVERFADGAAAGGPAPVVAVLGGSGGVGASTLATALAVTARRQGLDTLLVDGDPLGGGVDVMLGWEGVDGLRWPDLAHVRGRVSPPALVGALPGDGSLAVLSFDRSHMDAVPSAAMAAAIDAGRRGRDIVVVDLPRRFDDASVLALTSADRCYLVARADVRACAAAASVATLARRHCPALAVVVRETVPGGLRPHDVAEALDAPLAGALPPERAAARAGRATSARRGRGPLVELCRSLLTDFSKPRRAAA
jgi:secretion/DNA translocation related CpaE-like protein